jgi:hypothetical protein
VTAFERSLEAQSVPGTNLKGAVDEAHWYFLLPRLELGKVLVLGSISPSTLATLSDLADEAAVWAKGDDHVRLHTLAEERGLSNVHLLSAERGAGLPLPADDFDVLFVAQPQLVGSYLGDANLSAELTRVLKATAALYAEYSSLLGRRYRPNSESWLDERGPLEHLWAAPAWGEMRFAAPIGDTAAIEYLKTRFLETVLRRELLKRPRRVLARSPLLNRIVRRRAILAAHERQMPPLGPPRYIEAIAATAGVPTKGLRWAFAAPGDYSSQKALLFLFDDDADQPRSVVKITRDARHNARLENEWKALTHLQERGIGAAANRPEPLFFGHHAGRTILGETALAGVPFPQKTQASPDCPYAHRAIEWLAELGISTSHRPENQADLIARLEALLRRFEEIYSPEPDTARFLARQVDTVGQNAEGLRLVFQHGDPGPWNVLVSPTGAPGFLDWEAADPDGMPLWDVLHFLRSFAFSVSQKRGTRDALRSFADHVAGASPINALLVETTNRFCSESGLSPGLVEPLFYLCWVHRAVKQASRLPQRRLESGRYFNLVRLSVQHRDAPGLQRLFSLQAAS